MNWYSLMYLLAIAGGTAILLDEGRRRQFGSRWTIAVLAWAMGGVIGASLPYQLLGDLVTPRTAVGAVAGATIALFVAATLLLVPTGAALDTTATAIPLAGALARLGCFAAECCQGIATNLPIGVIDDEGVRRHPTQLYEAAFDVVIAAVASRQVKKRPDGHRFLISLAAMSVGRFMIEFARDSDKLGPLSLAQWITAPAAIIAIVIVAKRIELPRPRRRSMAVTALALQMPVISTDSLYPRDYVSGGVALFGSSFDWMHDTGGCDVRESWNRHHQLGGLAAEVGYRRQFSATRGLGVRFRPFGATETVSESGPLRINGGEITPTTTFPGYTVKHRGATIAGDLDFKYLGVTLGGSFGQFYPLLNAADDDHGHRRVEGVWPAMGLRLGTQRAALEIRAGDEPPIGAPLPAFTIALAVGDEKATRARFGVNDMGGFIAFRHVRPSGLEINPMFGSAHQGWMGGVMVKQWFRADGKPR